jgi:hypothetical protein
MSINGEVFDDEEEGLLTACMFCDHDEESVCCTNCKGRDFKMPKHPKECKCQKLSKEKQEKLTPPSSYLRKPLSYLTSEINKITPVIIIENNEKPTPKINFVETLSISGKGKK